MLGWAGNSAAVRCTFSSAAAKASSVAIIARSEPDRLSASPETACRWLVTIPGSPPPGRPMLTRAPAWSPPPAASASPHRRSASRSPIVNIWASSDPEAESAGQGVPVEYGQVTSGSSTVMMIRMTRKGPQGGTVMTYSQSENPRSRHHADQTRLYANRRWVPLTFTGKQINRKAKSVRRLRKR